MLYKDNLAERCINKEEDKSDILIKADAIKNGLVKEIGGIGISVLITIASFADKFNESNISQRKIASLTGLSKTTVNSAINMLLMKKINGEAVLKRKSSNKKEVKNYSTYAVNKNILTFKMY